MHVQMHHLTPGWEQHTCQSAGGRKRMIRGRHAQHGCTCTQTPRGLRGSSRSDTGHCLSVGEGLRGTREWRLACVSAGEWLHGLCAGTRSMCFTHPACTGPPHPKHARNKRAKQKERGPQQGPHPTPHAPHTGANESSAEFQEAPLLPSRGRVRPAAPTRGSPYTAATCSKLPPSDFWEEGVRGWGVRGWGSRKAALHICRHTSLSALNGGPPTPPPKVMLIDRKRNRLFIKHCF